MVVAAAVLQALAGAARGFAASLYDRPSGMELAIFNDLCFCCSLRSDSARPPHLRHTGHPHFEEFVSDVCLVSSRLIFAALIITASLSHAVLRFGCTHLWTFVATSPLLTSCND